MFSLYTTEDTLVRMCEEQEEWVKVLLDQKYVCISAEDGQTWDFSNPLLYDLYRAQVTIDVDNDLIEDIKADHSKVHELPNPYYIIDIDKPTAEEIEKQYGVICRTIDEYNNCPLFQEGWHILTTDTEVEQGWKPFFEGFDVPVNTIVIIDRYIFSSEGSETYEDSLYNIRSILDALLPLKAKDNVVHVALVFDGRPKDQLDKHIDFKSVLTDLNKLKRGLRNYPFDLEMLSISSDCYNYKETHDRRILTNYFTVEALHKIKAYLMSGIETCSQSITFRYLFTGIRGKKKSSTQATAIKHIMTALQDSIETSKNEILYGCNGQISKKGEFSVKNRFFTYEFN